jgi:hypothetical protein
MCQAVEWKQGEQPADNESLTTRHKERQAIGKYDRVTMSWWIRGGAAVGNEKVDSGER